MHMDVWTVKLSFLVYTGCTHNQLPKATFYWLLSNKERLEQWDTTAMLTDGSGLPVYGKIEPMGPIRNSPFSMQFLVKKLREFWREFSGWPL